MLDTFLHEIESTVRGIQFAFLLKLGAGAFLSVAWPTGVHLVILFCFRFSVVLNVYECFLCS